MRTTDIAIVGGGLAGSVTAAMLGRAGVDALLIDPHPVYPPDFRCEKLDREQVRVLATTGLAAEVLAHATPSDDVWIVRGRHVTRRHIGQQNLLYDTLVNAFRGLVPPSVSLLTGKVAALTTSADRQRLTLAGGEEIEARLVVLAMGLNIGLRHTLGMTRDVVSENHSISIGFDVAPVGRDRFAFPALTHYPDSIAERVAYMTLFPIGDRMRANLFVYRDPRDPWLKEMRHAPAETLRRTLPGLARFTGDFVVTGDVKIRPVDLYVTGGHRQPGIVLVGDAFCTSCPAAGTGAGKAINDAARLARVHIPQWLATPGMAADKIAAFYDDPAKVALDAHSAEKARYVRAIATDTSLAWSARRFANGIARTVGLAKLRDLSARRSASSVTAAGSAARSFELPA